MLKYRKKIKGVMIWVVVISILSAVLYTSAFGAESNAISCTVEITGGRVRISGRIAEAVGGGQASLLVGSITNPIYLDHQMVGANKRFEFDFPLPAGLSSGQYTYRVSSDKGPSTYVGSFYYTASERKFIDADIAVSIDNHVPSITGTLNCADGIGAAVSILNTTDNVVIADKTIASGGEYNVSCLLPSLSSTKEYTLSIQSIDGRGELAAMNVEISASAEIVSISGTAAVADDASANVSLESTNAGLTDKSAVITGNKSIDVTLRNIASNCSYSLLAEGYASGIVNMQEQTLAAYTLTGAANEEVRIAAKASNLRQLTGRMFTLEYSPEQLEAVSFFGMYPENRLGTGTIGKVEIVSYESGKVDFRIIGTEIPLGKMWSGVLNVFKFRFKDNYTGSTVVTLK